MRHDPRQALGLLGRGRRAAAGGVAMTWTLAYDLHLVVSALDNVPYRADSPERAGRCAEKALVGLPDFVGFTEAWRREVREALASESFGYQFIGRTSESPSLLYRADRWAWEMTEFLPMHGAIYNGSKLVADSRPVLVARFRRRGTNHKILVMVAHPTPSASWLSAAARAQRQAWRVIRERANQSPYPVVILGDFNHRRPPIGRRQHGVGIIRVVLRRKKRLKFGRAQVTTYKQASDHPGLRVRVPVLRRKK